MTKSKKIFRYLFFILTLVLSSFVAINVYADDVVVYNANTWGTFSQRTKDEIGERYSLAKQAGNYSIYDKNTWYDEMPSLVSPYKAGVASQDAHDVMVSMTNFYRWLVGVNPLLSGSTNNDQLQLEALIRNFSWGHYVDDGKKPADMSDEMWNQGSLISHNILSWNVSPSGSINNWLNEGYNKDYNSFDTIGHRTALIGSRISKLDFGYSEKIAIGKLHTGNTATLPYIAFPAPGYMPLTASFAKESAWDIEVNQSVLKYSSLDDIIVRVINLNNSSSYDCTIANGKLIYNIDYSNENELVFVQPDPTSGTSYTESDAYKVEVFGLKDVSTGKSAKIEYTVDFFDFNNYIDSKVSKIDIGIKTVQMYISQMTKENCDLITGSLPKTATITTQNNRVAEVPLNDWKLDFANKKWTTTLKKDQVPSFVLDNNNMLSSVFEINIGSDNNYVLFSMEENPEEGSSGTIWMHRYDGNAKIAYIYQINKNDETVLRYTNESDNFTLTATKFKFVIDSYNLNDTGTYYGIYINGDELYFGGIQDVAVKGKSVKNIEISSSPKNTYKVGESLNVTGGKLNVIYSDNSTSEVELAENMITVFDTTSAGIKEVTVTLDDKTAKYSILVVNGCVNLSATYGDKLGDIILPVDSNGTYSWANSGVMVGNAGTNNFNIIYNPTDGKYSSFNDIKANIVVDKAIPSYIVPTGLEANYGDTLSSVELPEGFIFNQASTTKVGNAGTNSFKVTYTPADDNNYLVVSDIDVNITVNKANPTYTVPTDLEAGFGDTLSSVILPEGFTFMDNTLSVGNVGTNSFKVRYTPSDINNYNVVENIDVNVKVGKATPIFNKLDEIDANYNDKLSSITLPSDSNGTYSFVDSGSTKVGSVGKHTFKVIYTPNDTINYRSVTFDVIINVKKINPDYMLPTDLEAIYGDKLSSIILPQGFKFMDGNDNVGNAGVNNFEIVYTPNDTLNYNVVTDTVSIKVNKANPEVPNVSLEPVVYGTLLKDISLPNSFAWKAQNNKVGNVGEKTFTAIYTPSDTNNYLVKEVELDVIVVKYKPNDLKINDLYATYGDTLGDVVLPEVEDGTYQYVKALSTKVGNVGEHVFYVNYIPSDISNYEIINNIPVKIIVRKAQGEEVVKPTLSPVTYDPNKKLRDIILPSGWTFDNPDTVPIVNNSGYKVTYIPIDTFNYDYSNQDLNPTINLVVNKANPIYDSPILTGFVGDKLSDITLPVLSNGTFSYQDSDFVLIEAKTTNIKVTFTPNDCDNYNVITDIEAVVNVNKTRPSYTVPTNLEAIYGDTLDDVKLPNGFTWNDKNTSVGNVGTKTFIASFTPDDLDNYSVVNNIEISVKVNKKKANKIVVPEVEDMDYNPNRKLSDINLGDNWSFDDGDVVPTVNNNGYKATYTPHDCDNYDYSGQDLNPTIKFVVRKINPTYNVPDNLVIEWNENIGDGILPQGFKFTNKPKFNIGENNAKLSYSPSDLDNYNVVNDIEVIIVVKKAKPQVVVPEDIVINEEDAETLKDIELPEGWKWVDEDIEVKGVLAYQAMYVPEDSEHYETLYADVVVNVSKYVDNTPNEIESPNTSDSLVIHILLNVISLVVFVFAYNKKKQFN